MTTNSEDKNSLDYFISLKNDFHEEEEKLKRKHRIARNYFIFVIVGLIGLLAYITFLKPTACTNSISGTPYSSPAMWQNQQQSLVDSHGNTVATLDIFVASNNHQWVIKSYESIESGISSPNQQNMTVSSILDKQLLSTLFKAKAVITIGMASAEGADKNVAQQKFLAIQRAIYLASTLKNHDYPTDLPLYTLDLGYFSSNKSQANHLQRSVIILAIQNVSPHLDIHDTNSLQDILYQTLKKNSFKLTTDLSVNDYNNFKLENF